MAICFPAGSITYSYPGAFGLISRQTITWKHCRELFHSPFFSNYGRPFLFQSQANSTISDIAEFIHKIETILELKGRSVFKKVQFGEEHLDNVMCIDVDPWWKDEPIRFSFFTAALRCAMNYKVSDDLNQVLYDKFNSLNYLAITPTATKKFLGGHTKYKGEITGFNGWLWAFDERIHPRTLTRVGQDPDAKLLLKSGPPPPPPVPLRIRILERCDQYTQNCPQGIKCLIRQFLGFFLG